MIYIASDHAGVELKLNLIHHIQATGRAITDEGPFALDSVDYPDFAAIVAKKIEADPTTYGILICGTGIGMSIAANRYAHVRAALCQSEAQTELARKHNNANVLCLGSRIISLETARRCVDTFLTTAFDGGRHTVRTDKLADRENPLTQLMQIEADAINFGFDWPNTEMAIDQIISECAEVKDALLNKESAQRVQEEISDLLHGAISLCTYAGFDVNETLSVIVKKFGGRMNALKTIAADQGLESLHGQSFEFMLELWREAKKIN
jgi:ribose 5-phosphate isomerase B